ncbi:hypothetical protein ACFL6C_01595 [Myxococcota bacterium]
MSDLVKIREQHAAQANTAGGTAAVDYHEMANKEGLPYPNTIAMMRAERDKLREKGKELSAKDSELLKKLEDYAIHWHFRLLDKHYADLYFPGDAAAQKAWVKLNAGELVGKEREQAIATVAKAAEYYGRTNEVAIWLPQLFPNRRMQFNQPSASHQWMLDGMRLPKGSP